MKGSLSGLSFNFNIYFKTEPKNSEIRIVKYNIFVEKLHF
jgi:hypothetical protein